MALNESVNIELGGKTYQLRYDFNALVVLEEELNLPIIDVAEMLKKSVRMKALRDIIWAGLLHANPSMTKVEAGSLIGNLSDLVAVSKAVRTAFEASFSPSEGKQKRKN